MPRFDTISRPDPDNPGQFIMENVPFTAEQDAARDAEEAAWAAGATDRAWQAVRTERDNLLAKTDWRFRSDQTPTQAWIDYCQALRDVTTQADPLNIVWPTEPV